MKKEAFYILLGLSVLVYISGLHERYIGTGIRADIFLFYEHPKGGRFVSNILLDISNMLTISYLLFVIIKNSVKSIRNVVYPFFWVSLADILDYFLFYKQLAYIKLILLIILIVIYNFKVPPK
jgi:hypothetical protein